MSRIATGICVVLLTAAVGIYILERDGSPTANHSDDPKLLRLMIGGEPGASGSKPATATGSHDASPSTTPNPQDSAAKGRDPWRPPEPELRHKVKKGDNPSKIAMEYLGKSDKATIDRILKANKLKRPQDLKVDSVLKIPVERFESFVADGRATLAYVAKRMYKDEKLLSPLRHANPTLPTDPNAKIPFGVTVFVPR